MSFTGIKSAGTILGSHEWQLDKLENFTITFWEKPTFTLTLENWLQDLGSWPQNFEFRAFIYFWTLTLKCLLQDIDTKTLTSGHLFLDIDSRILTPGHWLQNIDISKLTSWHLLPDVGSRALISLTWVKDIYISILTPGRWLLTPARRSNPKTLQTLQNIESSTWH